MSNVMREYEKDVNKRLSEMNNEMKELSSKIEGSAAKMLKKGFSYSDISDISGLKFDEIERIAFEIASNEPEYKIK